MTITRAQVDAWASEPGAMRAEIKRIIKERDALRDALLEMVDMFDDGRPKYLNEENLIAKTRALLLSAEKGE